MKRKIISTMLAALLIASAFAGSVYAEEKAVSTVLYDNESIAREIFSYAPSEFSASSETQLAWDPEAEPVYTDCKVVGSAEYQLYVYADGSYGTTVSTIEHPTMRVNTSGELHKFWSNIGGNGTMGITVRYTVNEMTGDYRISSVAKNGGTTGVAVINGIRDTYTPGAVGIASATKAWRKVERVSTDVSTGEVVETATVKHTATLIWDSSLQTIGLR
ncbi:MAG: hypothetical protein IKM61_00070 [Eubacteriaceae bacterium]|nr:hypothetical protein [Eubacteriaceae bacterium]